MVWSILAHSLFNQVRPRGRDSILRYHLTGLKFSADDSNFFYANEKKLWKGRKKMIGQYWASKLFAGENFTTNYSLEWLGRLQRQLVEHLNEPWICFFFSFSKRNLFRQSISLVWKALKDDTYRTTNFHSLNLFYFGFATISFLERI